MSFSSLRSSYFIPDFVEIQRKSFLHLLDKGLIQELYKRNPITNVKQNLELIFYPEYYKLNPPDWTPKEAILKSKTYACRLYVPIQLANKSTKEIKVQWVLLGNLPLMTKRGHFILNGSPRVIINQMVRSPGIYYQRVLQKTKKRTSYTYYADLISHRGAWLRLETDKNGKVWARMKKTPKVSILVFLQALGLTKEKIFQSINYSSFLKSSFIKKDHPSSSDEALRTLSFTIHPKKDKSEITPELGQKFLLRKFFNCRTYDLSELGRIQLNKKLGLSVPLTKSTLTEQDILFATDYLLKLEHGLGTLDDIDDLKNRRVRASGELIQNQLGTGFIRLEKMIREKLKKPRKKLTVRNLITTKPVNGALREFFGSSPLSQFMDQTNPLAELTHKRRLSSLGPGGISRETAGMAVRGIHPSHYGRICPIETPEGPNAGLVNSLTTYAKVNSTGFIETPCYHVYKGQIQTSAGPIFFSAAQEEQVIIAPGDLKLSQLDFLPKNTIPVRATKEFKKIIRDKVEYISISPIQMISIATSLIPFLEHDDANRALMGSNMQRQAVPLIKPERPIVGTGLEGRVAADSGHAIQSRTSGFVSYVSGQHIIIKKCIEPTLQTKSMFSKILRKTRKILDQPEKSSGLNLSESNYQSYLNKIQANSSESLSLNKEHQSHSTGLFKRKPLALSHSQNKKTLKGKQNLSLRNLPIKISSLKTDIKFKKLSVVKTLFSYIGPLAVPDRATGELNEINLSRENKLSEQKDFNRQKQIVKALLSPKPSTLFKFLTVNNLTTISLKKKNYFSIRFNPTAQLSAKSKNCQPEAQQGSAALKDVKNINFLGYSIPSVFKRTTFPQGTKFRSDLGVTSEKKIPEKVQQDKLQEVNLLFREKHVSKQHRCFKKNNLTYYGKKTFGIKTSILKLNFIDKFNWFHFLHLPLGSQTRFDNLARLELKPLQNSLITLPVTTKGIQWRTFSKLRFNDIQGWNQGYKSSKLDFLYISPYNFKVIGHLSYVDYFIDLGIPTLLVSEQGSSPVINDKVNKYIPWPLAEAKTNLLEIKLRFSNNSFSKFQIQSFKFNIEKNFSLSSVTYPLAEYQRSNQDTCVTQRPIVHEGDWVQRGDLLADGTASVGGELALGKTILIAYMPWEGYNFEDAILISERLIYDDVYTSIHIERYEIEIRDTKFGVEQITKQIPEIEASEITHLDTRGIAKIGSWIKEGDILVGKITPIQKKSLSPHEKLLYDIVKKEIPTTRDTSLRVPKSVHGRIVNIQILETENIPPEINFEGPGRVHIYIAEKRKIQVGDKMAGRHGNKGIISKILPRQDMPYLPDGTPLDMVLNPLGVPSRMNVGQVFECLLGLAGKQLGQQFKIIPFDEIYGPEASRSLVYSKLFEARRKTGQKWLFDPNFAGKTKLFDGRTGESFDQAVTVGQAYMLKLVHLVDEKIHARSTGPYSLVTQQPLRGRSKHGGQRLGEMEVWALEGFGAAYTLQELLTVKSDDMKGRHQVMDAILNNQPISLGTPESFKVLIRELQSLCLDVGVYSIESSGRRKEIDVMKLS
jgi:DNA-directed RNA polymerase beta subunit